MLLNPFDLNCRGQILYLSDRTHIMGILNVTPDSFSDGGKYDTVEKAIQRGLELEQEGADIIDIGAESTRPGAEPVSEAEELNRLLPVIDGLLHQVKVPLSVDTYKSRVAEEVLKKGVHLINDISGLNFDPQMKNVIAHYQVPVVIMHIQGTPRNMQQNPKYKDLIGEIALYLSKSIVMALKAGISKENIIIDPGIGFGKRLQDNFKIFRRLFDFTQLGYPVLIGPSRKSFIGKVLQVEPDQRLEGTAAAVAISIQNGANIVRVHDVAAMKRVCLIADLIVGKTKIQE